MQVRWAYPGNRVEDHDYEQSVRAWGEAEQRYAGRRPEWLFQDVARGVISEDEAFVASWVTFRVDGRPAGTRAFFVEAFRRDPQGWRRIRAHVEYHLPVATVET